MKTSELKGKSNPELLILLKEQKEYLRQLRFELSAKKLKKFSEIKKTKKTIARILTILD